MLDTNMLKRARFFRAFFITFTNLILKIYNMKKIYITICALAISFGIIAQEARVNSVPVLQEYIKIEAQSTMILNNSQSNNNAMSSAAANNAH